MSKHIVAFPVQPKNPKTIFPNITGRQKQYISNKQQAEINDKVWSKMCKDNANVEQGLNAWRNVHPTLCIYMQPMCVLLTNGAPVRFILFLWLETFEPRELVHDTAHCLTVQYKLYQSIFIDWKIVTLKKSVFKSKLKTHCGGKA